jgi:drug/metabolite transporter (DMT)-like permease
LGAVLSRKAYAVVALQGEHIDGATAAYQRIMGGLLIGGICLLLVKWRFIKMHLTFSGAGTTMPSKEKWRRVWFWVVANSLAGQTIGVSCYQWAFQTTPTGVVLPIVATTPLIVIPFAWWIDGERPSARAIVGGVIAVVGVAGLALSK